MTEKEYRSSDGVSRSELWRIRESPEKFKYYREHPEPPTPALLFGQVAHKLILEPETFDNDFAVAPDCNRRTKEGKALYGAFCDSLGDREAIPPADYQKAVEMAQACRASPFVGKLLDGEHEKPIYWTDDLTGALCKIRIDCLSKVGDKLVIVDYKTTADASNDGFMRHALNLGYDFQAGMYCEGIEKTTGQKPLFVFIAQEKTPPYSVNIFQADELFIRRGYDIFRELIGIYHDCRQSGTWWGYLGKYTAINNMCLPAWAKKEVE
jgi:exodeoxyribonuclease VIII